MLLPLVHHSLSMASLECQTGPGQSVLQDTMAILIVGVPPGQRHAACAFSAHLSLAQRLQAFLKYNAHGGESVLFPTISHVVAAWSLLVGSLWSGGGRRSFWRPSFDLINAARQSDCGCRYRIVTRNARPLRCFRLVPMPALAVRDGVKQLVWRAGLANKGIGSDSCGRPMGF